MKILPVFVLLLSGFIAFGQQKQVCFSFDDLPVVSYGITDTIYQKKLLNKLVSSLCNNKIPAIGFVNEGKLYDKEVLDQFQVNLLKGWADSGLDLGNHTYSHPDYNAVTFTDYSQDILKGETITKEILKDLGKVIRYFRHPFLHVGNSKVKADSLSDFLANKGYQIAPVTIDNDDYLFALAYKRAAVKKDSGLMTQIGRDYVKYMEKKLNYFEKQANRLFGRDINQILLLHASLINSDYIDSLIFMFKRNNYIFVSMDKATEDKAYKTDITVFGKMGISWLDRWALSEGKQKDFFRDDPATPDYIIKLAE